jgi:hypothetical protein
MYNSKLKAVAMLLAIAAGEAAEKNQTERACSGS